MAATAEATPRYTASNMPQSWVKPMDSAQPGVFREPGRISKNASRMNSRMNTAVSRGVSEAESYYSLPPMTARSLYVEPQFKRIDLPNFIRVNPLQPPTVPKRTVTMQTEKAFCHIQERVRRMQREQLARYHSAWSEPVYGDSATKERYRKRLREALKHQMVDAKVRNKHERTGEIGYTMKVLEQDDKDRLVELQRKIKHLTMGINVTKKNQELIQLLGESEKLERREVIALEQALLRIFPINPRRTLK